MKNITTKVSLFALMALMPMAAQAAGTATQTVTTSIIFDTPLTVDGTATINFGTVTAGVAETYTVSTAGVLSAVTPANILSSTGVAAAALAVHGSTFTTINVAANYSAAANGMTLQNATCNYGGAGEVACSSITAGAAPGASTPLLVGVSLVADNTNTANSVAETATFDIVVTYN